MYKVPEEESTEQTRTFTRGAVNPFLCFRGADPRRVVPPSAASPAELAQRLAEAGSVGVAGQAEEERAYLDPLDDPAVLAAMKAVDGGGTGTRTSTTTSGSGSGGDVDGDGEGELEAGRRRVLEAEPDAVLLSPPRATPLGRERERALAAQLDSLCPPLATTPRLQDKAVRAVLSVGVEVLVVDAASSAAMGPLRVTPRDLVTADQTDALFGAFSVTPAVT